MTRDELEFSISQYLDGTLVDAERAALDVRLGHDAEARALLDEYRRFDALLKAAAGPLPAVNWDGLAGRISGAIDEAADRRDQEEQERQDRAYRIGTGAGWGQVGRWAAMAASVAVAFGVGYGLFKSGGTEPTRNGSDPMQIVVVTPRAAEPESIRIVSNTSTRPDAAPDGAAAVQVVSVGPSDAVRDEPALWRYSDVMVSRPSHVLIASTRRSVQDDPALPY